MTRRIRFTPLLAGGAFVLACLAGAPGARAADVPFAARPALPAPPVSAQAVAHVDLDRDGDLDIVSGGSEVVVWHRNDGAGAAWTARTVGTFGGPLLSVLPADVDGDGDPDVVVAFPLIGVEWFENVDGLGASWTRHTLVGAPGLDSVALADVDRDGDTDLAAHSNGGARWYANDGAGGGWTPHTIGPASDSGALALADLDGDGDQDAVTVTSGGSQLVWYENTAGTGLAWTLRNVVTVSPLPRPRPPPTSTATAIPTSRALRSLAGMVPRPPRPRARGPGRPRRARAAPARRALARSHRSASSRAIRLRSIFVRRANPS